jgi:hypothetical protein
MGLMFQGCGIENVTWTTDIENTGITLKGFRVTGGVYCFYFHLK